MSSFAYLGDTGMVSTRTSPAYMSRQHTWNEIEAGWTPRLESWRCSQNAIGFEMSSAAIREYYRPVDVEDVGRGDVGFALAVLVLRCPDNQTCPKSNAQHRSIHSPSYTLYNSITLLQVQVPAPARPLRSEPQTKGACCHTQSAVPRLLRKSQHTPDKRFLQLTQIN